MKIEIADLSYKFEKTFTGNGAFCNGFYIQAEVREKGLKGWRRRKYEPRVHTKIKTFQPSHVDQVLAMWDKYQEVRSYLLKSPWAPAHMVERFGELTRRADLVLRAYGTPDLIPAEHDAITKKASASAAKIRVELARLLMLLMREAERDVLDDSYSQLQNAFREMQEEGDLEDFSYREIHSSYKTFMEGS